MRCKLLAFIIILLVLLTTGCKEQASEIIVPPDNISLDDATKIDLKKLDINKLSKKDIKVLDGIRFSENTVGYELEYRYPDTPIKIRIVKFQSPAEISEFWSNWLSVYGLQEYSQNQVVEFNQDNKYSGYAWQKGQWFTYIGVPNESLKEKVKTIVSNHYLNLAKKENKN
ncbi:MAG: hypothetical protein GXW85_03560 [Clostridia bacterium]|nr:hypothetical protein [Clostridia bacterium]